MSVQIRRAVVAAVAAAALVVAAGCGSSSDDSAGDNGSSSEPSQQQSSEQAPAPDTQQSSGDDAADESTAGGAAPSGDAGDADSCTLSDPVKVGVAFTLTGAAAQYGATQKNGVELAADQLNAKGGVTYDVDIKDTQTDPKQAISIFQGFVDAGDSVIIGPTLSNAAKQTDPVAQEAKMPVLGVSNTAAGITDIGDYIFRDSLTEEAVIPQTIKAAKDKYGLKKVVVLYGNDDAFTQGGYDAFKQALSDEGIETAKTLTFSKTDTDFRSLLTEAKSADPDALVVSALIEAAVPLVVQARQLGLDIPIIGGNGFNSPALMKDAGKAAEGVVVGAAWNSASDDPQSQEFMKAYQDKYGSAPDQFAAQAYTGMLVVDHAVRTACSADRDAIKDALGTTKDLATPLGDFSLDENRDAVHDAVVQIVQDGKFAVLK